MCIRDSQYSEDTAQQIDSEVKRIIDEAIERVRNTLKVRKQALVALTDRLIEVESVDATELQSIIDENSPGPLLVPGSDAAVRSRPIDEIKNDNQDEQNAAQ